MKQTIVILGKGYIGHEIASQFKSEGYKVKHVSKLDVCYTTSSALHDYLSSVQDEDKKAIVINCVGFTGRPNVDECELAASKPACLLLNAELPLLIASTCKSLNLPFIHISSGCIYNGYSKIFTETDQPNFGVFNPESSFYSKTKHQGELNLSSIEYGAIIRIRMPFTMSKHPRNFLVKINNYKEILNSENSVTSVEDMCGFLSKFIKSPYHKHYGIYNVVNPGIVTNRIIRALMGTGDKCRVVSEEDLLESGMTARRSNCMLSTALIESIGMSMPPAHSSLQRAVDALSLQ